MSKVNILPPDIISKIAAGEVIDRPASVIKELLENSLDAGADTVTLDLVQAGKTSIIIKDNGSGIAQDDMATVFQRHATSKISKSDDLFNIHSLGFRGEALYSIAAVSDIILRSKPENQDSGWELHLRGGKQLDLKPVAMNNGTEIEVKELFFNTPARRKFLKSNTSEMNHILNIVLPYTLLHPEKRFCLTHGGRNLLDLTPCQTTLERCAEVLNIKKEFIVPAQHTFTEDNFSIKILLGDINISRSKRDMQFLFINERPVQSKNISFHLNDVFRLILPPRQYPFFCVHITLNPGDVDVNIHPSKREVKIHNEAELCKKLRQLCEQTLMHKSNPKKVEAVKTMPEAAAPMEPKPRASVKDFIKRALLERETVKESTETAIEESTQLFSETAPSEKITEEHTIPEQTLFETQHHAGLKEKLEGAKFVGIFHKTFIFFEYRDTLLLVDQHAAQERITFEHLARQMKSGTIETQRLLTPYVIDVTPQEMLIWEEANQRFGQIGFETTLFDERTIALHTHPTLIKDPERSLRELLSLGQVARCDHDTLARRACRSSVMAGDTLSETQAEYQREQLLNCADPFTCPHGRPTVIELSEDFLKKQFLRT